MNLLIGKGLIDAVAYNAAQAQGARHQESEASMRNHQRGMNTLRTCA
jgi:hypothetical protein